MSKMRNRLRGESAQVLPMFVMLLIVLVGMIGLATDLGRIYVARAELGRSVDAAALAGASELPDIVEADDKAREYISVNEPDSTVVVEVDPNVASQQVEVRATKTVNTIFMRLFGVNSVNVRNQATAGFGVVPVNAVMAIDSTSSMGDAPCNGAQNNTGCPIWEAKNAAKAFTNTLLPGSNTLVGVLSYRGCFRPSGTNTNCVQTSTIGALSSDAASVITKINAISAIGGTGTNVCGGLDRAYAVLTGAGASSASNAVRVIVVLTDGDNNYNSVSFVSGTPGSPVTACRPTNTGCPVASQCSPSGNDASTANCGSGMDGSKPRERQLDNFTKTRADQVKAAGAEVYVVAFGVCGNEDNKVPYTIAGAATPNYCGNIGNTNSDWIADQRLLKCVASSTQGTNDHYFRANSASQLPGIFQQIAQNIAFRLIK